MIRNKKQLASSLKKLRQLEATIEALPKEHRFSYERLRSRIRHDVQEYRAISNGSIRVFGIRSVDDLAAALTKARIACGLTQRALAERLEVSEQMVQKDEAGGYEKASLARLAETADVLGYELVGELRPARGETLAVSTTQASASFDLLEVAGGAPSVCPPTSSAHSRQEVTLEVTT